MNKFIKGLALSLLISTPVMASDFSIATGKQGGYYFGTLGKNTAKVFRERGIKAKVYATKGSIDNLELLSEGKVDLAFVQADAFKYFSDKNPNADLEDIAVLGKECAFLAVKDKGSISNIDDLDKSKLVFAGKHGSGGESTLRYLMSMDNKITPQISLKGGSRALNKVKQGKADAYLWVQSPKKLDTRELKLVNSKNSGLTMAEIDLDGLFSSAKLPSGESVYSFEKVEYNSRGWGKKVTTACTSIVAVVNAEEMGEDLIDEVADLLNLNVTRIAGK